MQCNFGHFLSGGGQVASNLSDTASSLHTRLSGARAAVQPRSTARSLVLSNVVFEWIRDKLKGLQKIRRTHAVRNLSLQPPALQNAHLLGSQFVTLGRLPHAGTPIFFPQAPILAIF